jgi:hypothetical protein
MRNKLLQLHHRSERAARETALRLESQRAIVSRMRERESGSDVALSLLRQLESNLGLLTAHRDQLLRAATGRTGRAFQQRHRRREEAGAVGHCPRFLH